MSRVIVITSGKGGVGKTTTAVNLGAAINSFGENVVIVDTNLTTPNVGLHLGAPVVPLNLNHVLLNKADIEEAVYEHESGLKIIPSSLSIKDLKKIEHGKIKDLKKDLKKLADYIILDSSAGLGNEAMDAIDAADEIIIVTNPEMPAITDALKTIKIAEERKKPITGVIINRVRKNKTEMQPETVKEMLEVPILGSVPEELSVQASLNYKDVVVHTFPKSKVSRAYKEIAAKILGRQYNPKKDAPGFWERIFGQKFE
jgi:septum site-determining protein MinD